MVHTTICLMCHRNTLLLDCVIVGSSVLTKDVKTEEDEGTTQWYPDPDMEEGIYVDTDLADPDSVSRPVQGRIRGGGGSLTPISPKCVVLYSGPKMFINPLTAKLFDLNFHPLEVVSR